MKKLSDYFNQSISKEEEEKITKTLFANHFDRELKHRWKKKLAVEYNVSPTKIHSKNRFKLAGRITAIAASILLLFVLGKQIQFIFQSNNNLQQIASQHLSDQYIGLGVRKGNKIDSLRINATNAYSAKKYEIAVKEYNKIIPLDRSIIDDYFYLGLCHLYNNQPAESIPFFQKAMSLPYSQDIRDKEPIQWYLSLAFIKNQQLELAKEELQTLVNNSSNLLTLKEANELLAKIISEQKHLE